MANTSQYTQMVFAIIIEKVVWGSIPAAESLFGSVLIIGAAVWISLQRKQPTPHQKRPNPDEESNLLARENDTDD